MTTPDPTALSSLRARICALERPTPRPLEIVGVAAGVDDALPWGGLPLGCVHEVVADEGTGTAFCAMIAGRLAAKGAVLWCLRRADVYMPGVAAFGLAPERLIVARASCDREVLWCLEEGLRCPAVAAVVGEVPGLDLTAGRRLQLAAEAGGGIGLLLLPGEKPQPAGSAAVTRWRLAAAPSPPQPWSGLGPSRWRLRLERCRGGAAQEWLVQWNDGTGLVVVGADDDCPRPRS